MKFKFRDRVRVLKPESKLFRPDGSISQGEFFEGTIGTVIRYDPAKEGYLLVLDCPELSALMGENITANFREVELEMVMKSGPEVYRKPDLALLAPMEYPIDDHDLQRDIANEGQRANLTKEQRLKRIERKAYGAND